MSILEGNDRDAAHVFKKMEFKNDEKALVDKTVHPPERADNETSINTV